jgi:glycosyltransferase involved in cell wall biosynthesis
MSKKIKVLVISDHPYSPSGVGTQTRYMVESLLRTGDFSFTCLGGAVKHRDYSPQKFEEWGDDLVVYPVNGYGTQESVRSILRTERPDMLWFMTDPRFYSWLWEIEDEIRSVIPMVYYHVWDNLPYPNYNKIWYQSTDVVAAISKVTHDIVTTVSPETECHYLPHAVNDEVFVPLDEEKNINFRKAANLPEDAFVVFWNNRNARRKQPGTLIHWFKDFLERTGSDNSVLIMHTDPKDSNGPNLDAIIRNLGLTDGQVRFSTKKVNSQVLSTLYNAVDVTVNISDAEGFGLSTLESLSCGTPIIVNMTGGLQEQVTDGESWFGIGIEPASKAVIGSQEIPYIYEDRLNKDDFVDALEKMYNMSRKERKELGIKGREYVNKNYNFKNYTVRWEHLLRDIHDRLGSWETRKNYKNWELLEV